MEWEKIAYLLAEHRLEIKKARRLREQAESLKKEFQKVYHDQQTVAALIRTDLKKK